MLFALLQVHQKVRRFDFLNYPMVFRSERPSVVSTVKTKKQRMHGNEERTAEYNFCFVHIMNCLVQQIVEEAGHDDVVV